MTVTTYNETPLFEVEGTAVANTAPRGRRTNKEVVKTSSGETSQDIMKEWIDRCQKFSGGTPVPPNVISRLAKQVKSLIGAGYETNQIKYGLTVWTVRWMDNPLTAPEQLDRLTWKAVMDSTAEGQRFQAELKEAVTRFRGDTTALTGGVSKKEKRDIENAQGKKGWREALRERKLREGDA